MIYIGNDIVEVGRIRKSIQTHGKKFINKIFSQEEIDFCERRSLPEIHYAGRFAAKEAVKKALLSLDPNQIIPLNKIQISRKDNESPKVEYLQTSPLQKLEIQLSISHTEKYASAVALVSNQ